MSIGDTFKTCQKCETSGVYKNETCPKCGAGAQEIPLSKGEHFPPCRKCRSAITWRLIRKA